MKGGDIVVKDISKANILQRDPNEHFDPKKVDQVCSFLPFFLLLSIIILNSKPKEKPITSLRAHSNLGPKLISNLQKRGSTRLPGWLATQSKWKENSKKRVLLPR